MPNVAALGAVAVRRGPIGDIAALEGAVVVTNYGDDTVSLLNATTLAVDGVIAVPGEPVAVVVSDGRAYVSTSSPSYDAVSVIDTYAQTVIASYSLAFSVTALAVSPDGKRVYAGRTGDDYVDIAVIDTTAERVGTIDIASGAGIGIDAVEVDRTGKRLYVATTDSRGSALVVVDLETAAVERTCTSDRPSVTSRSPRAPPTSSHRTGSAAAQSTSIDLSTGRITDTVELGIGAPTQMTISADSTRAYIVDYDHVTVLCTLTLEDHRQHDDRHTTFMCRGRFRRRSRCTWPTTRATSRCSQSRRPCRCCTRSSWRRTPSACPRRSNCSPLTPDTVGRSVVRQSIEPLG